MKTNLKTRVRVVDEVTQPIKGLDDKLCFQKVVYEYGDGGMDEGFRFIYRDGQGRMKAQRGQANVMSLKMAKHMIANAEKKWPDVR